MRIGIFGSDHDLQCQAVAREAARLGADNVLLRADALDQGLPLSFADGRVIYRGQDLSDVRGYYVRQVPSPSAPVAEQDGELVMYRDWFADFMQSRERASTYVAWLLALERSGAKVVNPPQAGSMLQFKPYQLDVLRALGARLPRTLISNDPAAIRAFHEELGDVIFKPVMGGAVTRALDDEALARLDEVTASPVIFQERISGEDLRIILAGDELVSSVAIETPEQHLDFRADPVYSGGGASYREVELPEPVLAFCRRAARQCGLPFAGIDIKHRGDEWVFLELNSSPIYLDVELKLGHPISQALARLVVEGARAAAVT